MEEIEINFRLDQDGRTAPAPQESTDPSLEVSATDYSTHSRQASLQSNNTVISSSSSLWRSCLDELLLDCEISDSALMPRTFWVPAIGFTPRFSMEQMALDVFEHHTKNIPRQNNPNDKIDWTKSGAEWWVQIRPSPRGGRYSVLMKEEQEDRKDVDGQEDLSKDGISFHWDKDEDLRLLMGGNTYIHPHISTVTYLTDVGAPTLAVNRRINPLTGAWIDHKMNETAHDENGHGDSSNESEDEAFLSWPSTLKHLSFDGRYLHAAIPTLAVAKQQSPTNQSTNQEEMDAGTPKDANERLARHQFQQREERRKRRVTFLVNIWLHFHPLNVHPFPESMLDKMSGYYKPDSSSANSTVTTTNKADGSTKENRRVGLSLASQQQPTRLVTVAAADDNPIASSSSSSSTRTSVETHTWPMGSCGSGETITMRLPHAKELQQHGQEVGENVRLTWSPKSRGIGVKMQKTPLQNDDDDDKNDKKKQQSNHNVGATSSTKRASQQEEPMDVNKRRRQSDP